MEASWTRNQRLHPVLSKLQPECLLRERIAQGLKVHVDNEFYILWYLAEDFPGGNRSNAYNVLDYVLKSPRLSPAYDIVCRSPPSSITK